MKRSIKYNKRSGRIAQTGVALVTALFLVALVTAITAAWVAQFDAAYKRVETLRVGAQSRWLLRAGLGYAAVILGESNAQRVTLNDSWAVPLSRFRMTDIAGTNEAFFSGQFIDAQGRLNACNLARETPSATLVQWGKNLAQAMPQGSALSEAEFAQWQIKLRDLQALSVSENSTSGGVGGGATGGANNAVSDTYLRIQTDDALAMLPKQLNDAQRAAWSAVWVWLPCKEAATKVNVNTAPAAVIKAHPVLSGGAGAQLLADRSKASFNDLADLTMRFTALKAQSNAGGNPPIGEDIGRGFDVASQYFLAQATLEIARTQVFQQTLFHRRTAGGGNAVIPLWSKY